MKKFFIIFGFLLFFVSSIYSQVKVESGRVTINSNSASAEGNFVVVGSLVNYVYQDNNYNYYMRMQIGTTNPRIAGSQDCVVFYNNLNSRFNDLQVKEIYYMSDRNSKTNINPVFNALEQVKYLNPVTYDWNNQNKSRWKNNQNQKQNQHDIGFITQDVEQVLPGIVAEDEEGNKLLNYTAIIPILTKAIKELNDKVDELEKKVSDLSSKGDNSNKLISLSNNNSVTSNSGIEFSTDSRLNQTYPNPASAETKIRYFIPKIETSASICILNLQGSLILQKNVNTSGDGEVVIQAGKLLPGMYMYSLVVDDRIIDTKRMLLTE